MKHKKEIFLCMGGNVSYKENHLYFFQNLLKRVQEMIFSDVSFIRAPFSQKIHHLDRILKERFFSSIF